jgi:cytochrome P450
MKLPNLPGPPDSAWSQLKRLRHDFLAYLMDAARYGELVLLKPAPMTRIVLVNSPPLIEEILAGKPEAFRKSSMTHRLVGKFLGGGLVLAEGEGHREARRKIQPAFGAARIARLAPMMALEAKVYMDRWPHGEVRTLPDVLSQLMLRVAARTLFGTLADVGTVPAMQQFAQSMALRFRSVPWPEWVPIPRHAREEKAIAVLDAAVTEMLRRPTDAGDDLLSLLREPGLFDRNELRDHIVTLYFAGHETTAKLLGWALWRLSRHPDMRARVASELRGLPHPAAAGAPERMPFTDAVLKETLRLHPPAWLIDREPVADVQLGSVLVPAGTTLYLSPYVAQRDARVFPDPERFDPMRFLSGEPPGRGSYFPFGFGPRSCIGRGFAESAARVLLAAMLEHVSFDALSDPVAEPFATLGLGGDLRVRRR